MINASSHCIRNLEECSYLCSLRLGCACRLSREHQNRTMAIRVAALLAGLLLAGAVPASAARFHDALREADLCILHTAPEDCAAHADKCVTCHASIGGVDVCMETAVARKLPASELSSCTGGARLPACGCSHPLAVS